MQISQLPNRRAFYAIKQIVTLSDKMIAILEDALPINFVHIYNVKEHTIVSSFRVQSIGFKSKPRALISAWHHKRIVACYEDDWSPKTRSDHLETFDASGHFMDPERMPTDDHVIPLNNYVLTVNNGDDDRWNNNQCIRIYAHKPDYESNDEYQAQCPPNSIQQPHQVIQNPYGLLDFRGPFSQYALTGVSLALGCLSAYRLYRKASPREVCLTAASSLATGLAAIKLYTMR